MKQNHDRINKSERTGVSNPTNNTQVILRWGLSLKSHLQDQRTQGLNLGSLDWKSNVVSTTLTITPTPPPMKVSEGKYYSHSHNGMSGVSGFYVIVN